MQLWRMWGSPANARKSVPPAAHAHTHTGADGYHMNIDTVTTVCPAGAGAPAACVVSHALGTWGHLQPHVQIGTYCLEPGSYEYEAHSNCAVAPVPVTFDHDEEKSTWRVTLPTLSALKDAWTVRRRQLQLAAGLLGAFSHLCLCLKQALQSCTELPSKCRFALDAGQKAMVYTLWRDKPGSIHHQHVIITATAP